MYNVNQFTFFRQKNGIGYGNCAVYTAPYSNAYRCANGKASCDTNHDMYVGGFDESGWLMVRYDTSDGGCRVGYISPSDVRGFKFDRIKFQRIQQTAAGTIKVTDNPLNENSAFAYLNAGETYYILAQYTFYGNWWYIECDVDGQPARGFISKNTTALDMGGGNYSTGLGIPEYGPHGERQIGTVRITHEDAIVRKDADSNSVMVTKLYYNNTCAAFGMKTGSTGRPWYYIYTDGMWGWVSSGVAELQ